MDHKILGEVMLVVAVVVPDQQLLEVAILHMLHQVQFTELYHSEN
jgi:hypothetical protein